MSERCEVKQCKEVLMKRKQNVKCKNFVATRILIKNFLPYTQTHELSKIYLQGCNWDIFTSAYVINWSIINLIAKKTPNETIICYLQN